VHGAGGVCGAVGTAGPLWGERVKDLLERMGQRESIR